MTVRDFGVPNMSIFRALNSSWAPNSTLDRNSISSRRRLRAQDETEQLHPGFTPHLASTSTSRPPASQKPSPRPKLSPELQLNPKPGSERESPLPSKPRSKPASKLKPNQRQAAPPAQQSSSAPSFTLDPSAYQRIKLFPPCPGCYRLEDRSKPSVSSF
jgi:hypothetical protein